MDGSNIMSGSKLNGSVDLLAKAMRQVFTEDVADGVKLVKDAVDGMKRGMDDRFARLEEDVENRFAELHPPK